MSPDSWLVPAVISVLLAALFSGLWTPVMIRFLRDKALLRPNFLGEAVPCPLGLALLAAALPSYWILSLALPDGGHDLPALLVALFLTALAGLLDDLTGAAEPKGLRGHLAAFRRGHLTAGTLKATAGVLAGLTAAAPVIRRPGSGGAAEWIVDAAVVALSANAFNALDLRPGRAAKAFLAAAGCLVLPGSGRPDGLLLLAPLIGAVAGYLPFDLDRRGMLGDTGANPLGAAAGLVLASRMDITAGIAALLLLLAFHLLTERLSLTRVIDANPLLRRLDLWGRREP